LLVLDPPVIPLPVPGDGERAGSDDVEPAPDGDEVLLGRELEPDVGALPPAAEPCTLEDVPLVGGQEQFAALLPELLALGEAEELLALGEVEELLALGVELVVPPTLEGDVVEPLALDGELLLPVTDPVPVLAVPPALELEALGGQLQFSAPPVLGEADEPLVLDGELEEPLALGVLLPLVELPPIAPPVLDGCELWVLCDWPVVLEDCAYAALNAPITASAVILTANCRTLMGAPLLNEQPPLTRKPCAERGALWKIGS